MTRHDRVGLRRASQLGSITRSTPARFSLVSQRSQSRQSPQQLTFPSPMRLTSVRADAARIPGIGKRWRNSLEYRPIYQRLKCLLRVEQDGDFAFGLDGDGQVRGRCRG